MNFLHPGTLMGTETPTGETPKTALKKKDMKPFT
jgi:hypothetical protein